ncbi:isoprenylcysteine carboxyl methyltransferase family protein [Pelagibius sp.]|uniref:isoprenylcysteine carboxyl methyltransferase family protein n=1 Tax=Pelagibius sp. TaxID=1931238 RepID=UPI003BAFD817
MSVLWAVLILVALQRLGELVYARRNTRRLLAEGGQEIGAGHYPLLVGLHTLWLLALLVFVPADAPASWPLLGIFLVLQLLRLWVLITLGRYWTTRIITLPDVPLVRKGPYRLFRHPNYLVVAGEILVLPLAFGAWEIALAFSVANAIVLAVRISCEERAIAPRRSESLKTGPVKSP